MTGGADMSAFAICRLCASVETFRCLDGFPRKRTCTEPWRLRGRLVARKIHGQLRVEGLRAWPGLQLSRLPAADEGGLSFLDDGHIDLDTNPVERAIRAIAPGRRRSPFVGSEDGDHCRAIVASLVDIHDRIPSFKMRSMTVHILFVSPFLDRTCELPEGAFTRCDLPG